MGRYKCHNVMFDMDGVIVNTSRIHSEAFQQVFSEYDVEFDYDIWKGSSTKEVVFGVFKDTALSLGELEELITKKQNLALLGLKSATLEDLFFDEAIESLCNFAQVFNLGLCTSAGKSSVEHILKVGGLNDFFSFVISSNDVSKSKPNPEIYAEGAKRFRVPANECLVIEDSRNGLISARLAGCQTIHFGNKNERSLASLPFFNDLISVASYSDLRRLLL